ncbi:hypothetical protein A3770_10p58350 [Chloropicon primus]|uniref:RRM domain-containing protein n=1 Tax=Chloropicon primus TaxID=1764295 RepID=A0A5B8MSR0_9CHLO|nr:hypothetical protein A3770_10p58350 [Chloropicon primus]|eukprot:QDZ23317.1 hypothetical protein A3770_10p58350 [Chloropicon primus]
MSLSMSMAKPGVRYALGMRHYASGGLLVSGSSSCVPPSMDALVLKFGFGQGQERRGMSTEGKDKEGEAEGEKKGGARARRGKGGGVGGGGGGGGYLHGRQYAGKEKDGAGEEEKGRDRRRRFVPMASRGRGKDALGGSFASRILGGRGLGEGKGRGGGGRGRQQGGRQRDGRERGDQGRGQQHRDRTIYVKGLNYNMSEDEVRKGLTELFGESCGRVQQVRIPMDREQDRHKGYCFVKFEDPKAKVKALEDLDGTEFGDRWLTIDDGDSRGRSRAVAGGEDAPRQRPVSRDAGSVGMAADLDLDDQSQRMRMRRRKGRETQQQRQRRDGQPKGNVRSGQVKRSNRFRRQGQGEFAFASSRVDLEEEAKDAEKERIDNLDKMLEILTAKGSVGPAAADYDEYFTEYERHEHEEELVADLLSAFHPNLAVQPVNMSELLVDEAASDDGPAAAGDFVEEYKQEMMEILQVGEEDWKLISQGAEEDIRRAGKRCILQSSLPAGKVAEEREISQMTNLIGSDDPLKNHMVKAMSVLQSSAGWNHEDRKKYVRNLIELS